MMTGPEGKAVMHYFERCKLKAYPDPASPLFLALVRAGVDPYELDAVPAGFGHLSGAPWSIGWGDTGPDVMVGLVITQDEADERFAHRLAREFEPGVEAAITSGATQRQFDALICFSYNLGLGALRDSTLLRLHNDGRHAAAADQFPRWNRAGGKVMKGLQRRRAAERLLYKGLDAKEAIAQALALFP